MISLPLIPIKPLPGASDPQPPNRVRLTLFIVGLLVLVVGFTALVLAARFLFR